MSIGMPPDPAEIHRKTHGSARELRRPVRYWDGDCAPADCESDKPLLPSQRSHGGDPTHVGTAWAREKRLADRLAIWPSVLLETRTPRSGSPGCPYRQERGGARSGA